MELRLIIHNATDRRSSGRRTEGRFTEKKIKREKGRENEAERKRGKERDRKRNKTCRYICISYSNIRRCFEEFYYRCYYRRAKDNAGKILNRDSSR